MIDMSIIIPTYNRFRELSCVLSDFANCDRVIFSELIIVDDCSSDMGGFDDFKAVFDGLTCFDSKSYFSNDCNRGACYSRNFGLKKASGKFIYFLDSDDFVLIDQIQAMMYDEALGDFDMVVSASRLQVPMRFKYDIDKVRSFNLVGPLSGVIFKKCILKTDPFDVSLESCQDWDMYINGFTKHNNIKAFLVPSFFKYVVSDDSITLNETRFVQGRIRFFRKNLLADRFMSKAHFLFGCFAFAFKRKMLKQFFQIAKNVCRKDELILSILILPYLFLIFMFRKFYR